MAGSDPDIFYGLHAAVTRRNKQRLPSGGWFAEEAFTPEEAVRAYTVWNAYAMFAEDLTGIIAPGRWADLTVMNIDPLRVGESDPGALLSGQILMTIVAGRIAWQKRLAKAVVRPQPAARVLSNASAMSSATRAAPETATQRSSGDR